MPGKISISEIDTNKSREGLNKADPCCSAGISRRNFIKNSAGYSVLSVAGAAALLSGCDDPDAQSAWAEFFQSNYQLMSAAERAKVVRRLEAHYSKTYNKPVKVNTEPAQDGVLFGAALNIQKCIGCRRCVEACAIENNQSRAKGEEIEWIRVIKNEERQYKREAAVKNVPTHHDYLRSEDAEQSTGSYLDGEHYYAPDSATVPEPDSHYLPVSCMQCENPPCVSVCPVKATYREADGIVVIDYNWCIGCRMCMQACPYWARRFNWKAPSLPADAMNPNTHYLGNRPRMQGVVEKCTFCIQRVRTGRYPACVEACPVGARKFGNLLDPDSDVRKVLANKRVFRLRDELNTDPKFFYFMD